MTNSDLLQQPSSQNDIEDMVVSCSSGNGYQSSKLTRATYGQEKPAYPNLPMESLQNRVHSGAMQPEVIIGKII